MLEIIEAQSGNHAAESLADLSDIAIDIAKDGTDVSSNKVNVFDTTAHDYNKLYPIMFRICVSAKGKEDTARALGVAFNTYDKMIERGLKPRGKTFELMYITVENFIQHHPDIPNNVKSELKNKVITAAQENDVSRGELMGRVILAKNQAEDDDANEGIEINEQ